MNFSGRARSWALAMGMASLGALSGPATAGDPAGNSTYKVISLDGVATGWIVGRCRIAPIVPRWNVTITKRCAKDDVVPREVPTECMIAAADGGLSNCVVWLKEIAAGKDWPKTMRLESRTAALEVGEQRYAPHVTVVRAGTQLSVANHGACDTNCHGYFGSMADTQFNFAVAPGETVGDLRQCFLERPGLYLLRDDCCTHMTGFLRVTENPYFAVTSAEGCEDRPAGSYSIGAVPPGEYEVVCWHENMEEPTDPPRGYPPRYDIALTKKAKVGAGETVALDFTLPAPEGRSKK